MPRGKPVGSKPLSSIHVEKRTIACVHSINEAVCAVLYGEDKADWYKRAKFKPAREHGLTRKIKNLLD